MTSPPRSVVVGQRVINHRRAAGSGELSPRAPTDPGEHAMDKIIAGLLVEAAYVAGQVIRDQRRSTAVPARRRYPSCEPFAFASRSRRCQAESGGFPRLIRAAVA